MQRISIAIASLLFVVSVNGCGSFRHVQTQQQTAQARAITYDGLSAMRQGQTERATQLFAEAASLAPDDFRIHENMAISLAEQGAIDEAIQRTQAAIQLSPAETRLHVQLGQLYMRRHQPHLAENQSKKALHLDRKCCAAWTLQGQAQAAQGKLDEALISLLRAASVDPYDQQIPFEIAHVYQRQGRSSLALASIETLRRSYPAGREPVELLTLEGEVLLSLNRPERAITRLARLAQVQSPQADALLVLCRAYVATGDYSNARLTAGLANEQFPADRRFALLLKDLPSMVTADVADNTMRR